MTRINTNVASLRGLNQLNNSQNMLQTSLTRLSTGLQINSGADDPAGLIESNTLSSQIASINQSINNSNDANNVLSTADSGLSEISGLLDQVRGLVQAGLNSGALSTDEIQANQSQIDQALSAINRISSNVSFAGSKLIDGSKAYQTQTTSADAGKLNSYQINSAAFAGSSNVTIDTKVTAAATKGQLYYNFNNGGLASKTTLQVSGASGSNVVFLGAGSSLDNIKSAINAVSDSTGVDVTKTAAVYGAKTFASTGTDNDLTFTDIRNQTSNPDDATVNGKTLKVQIVAASASQTLAVSSTSTATDITLSITLGTDSGSAVTSTASDVKQLLQTNAASSSYVAVSYEGDGSGLVAASQALASVTSGAKDAYLSFQSQDFGSSQFVGVDVLQGAFSTTTGSTGGNVASRSTGTDIQATINGQQALGSGLTASIIGDALNASVTFNTADNTANTDAKITVTGGGSVFQIGEDATVAGQINLGIPSVNTATLGGVNGKLFQLGSGGGKSLLDVGSSLSGSALVSIIDDATTQVSNLRGQIGSLQKNVIDTNIATLNSTLENVSTAKSQITDTDFAAETSNLTRAQILSQSGISVLAIANQAPQAVLKLLG
jgi:flagellin